MNYKNFVIGLGILLWLPTICLAAQPDPVQKAKEEIIDRISSHYYELETFRAVYEQIAESKTLGGAQPIVFKDVSEGELVFKKPDLILLDQKEPRKELLVSNGKISWWYIPDEEKAYKYTSQSQSGALQALAKIFSGKGKLTESFIVTILEAPDQELRLRLEPLQLASDFEYLDIALDLESLQLKSLVISYLMGQVTSFTFAEIEENADVSPDVFVFTPPKGTEIIEGE